MRRLFTSAESGLSNNALRWAERTGESVRVQRGVYAEGPEPPTPIERTTVIGGVRCVGALQALVDIAAHVDDDTWEQALETALRKRLVSVAGFHDLPPNVPGVRRIRRVLDRRGDVPPTESLLETLMVQLIRSVPGLPEPVRQLRVTWPDGSFIARVDLCWPGLGVFIELDGQGHNDQPVYDAHRQTAVVAATGWRVARFTWREVTRSPRMCARRLLAIVEQLAA